MKKRLILIILLALMSAFLLTACKGSEDIENSSTEEQIGQTTEKGSSATNETENNTKIEDTEQPKSVETEENLLMEKWYIKENSVQTVFSFGEKFNYRGIVAVHEKDGIVTEYPEDDIYVNNEPALLAPGTYTVEIEILPTEDVFTYEVTVKDIDISSVSPTSPVLKINGSGEYKYEAENIDFSNILSKGELLVNDTFADGGVYVKNYGNIGNCFGFVIESDVEIEGATLRFRMANYSVTMIYPAKDMAIYQNYVSIDDNIKIEINPDLYLTTRAPSMAGQEGADPSLVWCNVTIENVTLYKGENRLMIAVIGNEVPYLDSITVIVP